MSRELRITYTTAKAVYCHVFSDDGLLIYNGVSTAFALPSAVSVTDWGNAATALACTEEALSTAEKLSLYVASLPAAMKTTHAYMAVFREKAGASPATTDAIIGTQVIAAESIPSCIQTAVNDASATTTTATLDYVDPLPDALVGWLLTVRNADLVDETVAISDSTAAGVVTYASLSEAPADDDSVTIRPPASL